MPIFEYACDSCSRRFSLLEGMLAEVKPAVCPACGGAKVTRQVSRFSRLRSEDESLDSLSDDAEMAEAENDPKALRRLMQNMGSMMDEPMADDLDQVLDEEYGGAAAGTEAAEE